MITVKRTGGTAGQVQVDYATSDGTARIVDNDYGAAAGTLVFGPGVASKTFGVPILPDALDEGSETLQLTLTNATGATILGTNPVTRWRTARRASS